MLLLLAYAFLLRLWRSFALLDLGNVVGIESQASQLRFQTRLAWLLDPFFGLNNANVEQAAKRIPNARLNVFRKLVRIRLIALALAIKDGASCAMKQEVQSCLLCGLVDLICFQAGADGQRAASQSAIDHYLIHVPICGAPPERIGQMRRLRWGFPLPSKG